MNQISFLRGVPAEEALEAVSELIATSYGEVVRAYGPQILQYQTPGVADFNGFIPLKQTLARRFGIEGDPNKRLICLNGGMEVLSMLLKSFPRGSRIAMEALTYDRALVDALRYEHEVVGIPFTSEGIELDVLEKELSSGDVKLFYRIIYHQNPTGLVSTLENIEAAAEICAAHNTLYACDIAYYELRYDGQKNPGLDLSKHTSTCLIGSFTKTIAAGTKCGFGIFPEAVVERVTPVIANTRLNPNYPTQAVINSIMVSGEYDRHLDYLTDLYRPRLEAFNTALSQSFPELEVLQPKGGFFSGIWLSGIQDETAFIAAAKTKGVSIAPANVFPPGWAQHYRDKQQGPFFRLTFPALKPESIVKGIELLGETYREIKP
jgi:2-aminoadipate transaminase